MRLKRSFYTQPTLKVAKNLLGQIICRRFGNGRILRGKIVETEAYIGPNDKASHAIGGRMTKRNLAEFLIGGHIYIYLVYGMYWQFNISTSKKGKPECVLIRAIEPIIEKSPKSEFLISKQIPNHKSQIPKLTNGPGKLCRYLGLDKSFYGEDLVRSEKIWLEKGEKVRSKNIIAAKRIGIDYAGKYWASRKWRFYIKGNKWVSKK